MAPSDRDQRRLSHFKPLPSLAPNAPIEVVLPVWPLDRRTSPAFAIQPLVPMPTRSWHATPRSMHRAKMTSSSATGLRAPLQAGLKPPNASCNLPIWRPGITGLRSKRGRAMAMELPRRGVPLPHPHPLVFDLVVYRSVHLDSTLGGGRIHAAAYPQRATSGTGNGAAGGGEDRRSEPRKSGVSLLSFTDPLTGLANRRAFDQALEKECVRLRRTGAKLSLLAIDVDLFKALNDSQGHLRGDEYLALLGAELLKIARRQIDVVARIGGEEFAIILPITGDDDALLIAESIRQTIAALRLPHPESSVVPYLTVSVGVATATSQHLCTPESLTAAADRALYDAKRSGRNRVCVAAQPLPVENSNPTPLTS